MAAATIARRSTSTFARTILRSAPIRTAAASPRSASQVSVSNGFAPSSFSLRSPPRISLATSPIRMLRRELSTLVPIHSAIAAACLVSKLPADANTSIQGNCDTKCFFPLLIDRFCSNEITLLLLGCYCESNVSRQDVGAVVTGFPVPSEAEALASGNADSEAPLMSA